VTRIAILAALAACGGRDLGPSGPADRTPRLQLLQCAPAAVGPILADDGVSFGGLTKTEILEMKRAAKLPRVVIGTPNLASGLESSMYGRVLRRQLDKLRGCYDRELVTNPLLAARLEVTFTVAMDGGVSNVSVPAATPTTFAACLSRVILAAKFPSRVSGGSTRVSYPLTFDHGAPGVPPSEPVVALDPEAASPEPWSPYAEGGLPPEPNGAAVARLTERAVRSKLEALAGCFAGAAPTGSLRAMLALSDGRVRRARIGGLGDPASESCIAKLLVGLEVKADEAEIACDLSRGDAQRWRVSPASYEVITTTPTAISHRGRTLELGATEPDPLPGNRTYLIVVGRDTPGTVLEAAISWAFEGDATLVALQGEGAPAFVGVARSTYALGDPHDDVDAVDVSLEVDRTQLAACVRVDAESAPLADAKAVRRLLAGVAERCKRTRCASTVGLKLEGGGTVGALAEVVDALRHAGFARVLIGGGIGCRSVRD